MMGFPWHFSFAWLLGPLAGAGALGILLWWIVREQRRRLWLPIMRIIDLEPRRLPRWHRETPPWIAFICFLLLMLALLVLSLRPSRDVTIPEEPRRLSIHIMMDMSPSVSGFTSLADFAKAGRTLWETMRADGKITVSSTHSGKIVEPKDGQELEQQILKLGFHRAGAKLGQSMAQQIGDLGRMDRLVVVSDGDQFSWSDFDWKFLQPETSVLLWNVAKNPARKPNIYVENVRLANQTITGSEWACEIVRSSGDQAIAGSLLVKLRDQTLATVGWSMPADISRQRLQVTLKQDDIAKARDLEKVAAELVWQVQTPAPDAFVMDNDFRTIVSGKSGQVLMLAEPGGEQEILDPLYQLQRVLTVMGFGVRRLDYASKDSPKVENDSLWVLAGGMGNGVNSFCPQGLTTMRRNMTSKSAKSSSRLPTVWLVPRIANADFREICWCFDRILNSKDPNSESPKMCSEVNNRDDWIQILAANGAKQIGGTMGSQKDSLAWYVPEERSGVALLAVTIPLQPQVAGISYSQFPLIVKDLLQWNGLLMGTGLRIPATWPRLETLADILITEGVDTKWSNVPMGESQLLTASLEDLPPAWVPDLIAGAASSGRLKVERESNEILRRLVLGVLALVGIEILAFFGFAGWRRWRGRFAVILVLFAMPSSAEAQIDINLVGYDSVTPYSWGNAAREVARRTSIDLAPNPKSFASFDKSAMEQPWLWVRDVRKITGPQGRLLPEVQRWVKRGGFMVIEDAADTNALQQMVDIVGLRDMGATQWQIIPPDHEMMRSFHLLDALPSCGTKFWQGLQFDGRLAMVAIPYRFLDVVADHRAATTGGCAAIQDNEKAIRALINMLMVVLATDYKRDQIHLPEILKRLR